MHRTPHTPQRDDQPRRLFRARWALTALAAAAVAACGGGSSDEPTTPANQAPGVTLDAPAANANFFSTDTVHITATASDLDGTVAKVEFLADGVKIGEDTSAPFEFDWVNPPVGAHALTVRAIDNAGASTLSASRTISSAQNQLPTVAMAAPANNFKANAPTAVLLSANASDTDGTIAKVEFFKVNPAAPVFDATTLVGEATTVGTPPAYQLTTAPLTAGTYHFVARATDNKGETSTSASVQVIMNALPAVSITAPTAGASIIPGTNYTLRATASDGDGSISKVEFFLNGSATPLPGTVTKSGNEYSLAWTAVTGAVSFTARATDNDGAQTTTASVAANVPPNVLPTVTLDNPAAGTNAPTTLNLSASAADGDGSVTGVEFSYTLNGGAATKANGTLTAGKWTLAVPVSAAQFGTYAVTATVTDNLGGKTTSASKNVSIAANVPPTVNVTSNAAQTLDAGNAPKTLTLTASASDSDNIAKVEFFANNTGTGTPIGTATCTAVPGTPTDSTCSLAWANKTAGTYTVTAKATDTVGSTRLSDPQTLVVTPNLLGPWATLNATQKAGITLEPDEPVGTDGATDAGQVLTAIGPTTVVPALVAAMSQGLRKLADLQLTDTGGYVACPRGGTMRVQNDPGDPGDAAAIPPRPARPADPNMRIISYNNCTLDDPVPERRFTFYGGSDVAPYIHQDTTTTPPPAPPTNIPIASESTLTLLGGGAFRIVVKSVKVSGNGAPEPGGGIYPRNAFAYSIVECDSMAADKKCKTNLLNSFVWGHDLSWAGWLDNALTFANSPLYQTDDSYTLNGTMRPCQADPQTANENPTYCQTIPGPRPDLRYNRHFKFDNMTNNSGRAVVYGNNGWAEVVRLAPEASGTELLTVQRTLTGGSPETKRTYRCNVDSNGFWACVLKP